MCNVLASDLFRNLGTSKISIPFACLYNYSVSILNKRQFFFHQKATASRGSERKYSKLDILAALVLAETAFLGPYTSTRKAVSEVAVAFAAQNKTFP